MLKSLMLPMGIYDSVIFATAELCQLESEQMLFLFHFFTKEISSICMERLHDFQKWLMVGGGVNISLLYAYFFVRVFGLPSCVL